MAGITRDMLKNFQKLSQKKIRQRYGLFLIEGHKIIEEFLKESWPLECILYTKACDKYSILGEYSKAFEISEIDFMKISNLTHPQHILAIAKIIEPKIKVSPWKIALDGIQDPGNLGTIIRTAEWFGITEIYCSTDTVDCFNPKVVQASMGSLTRVKVHYGELSTFLKNEHVFATLLVGEDFRALAPKPKSGIILLGNEGNGIASNLLKNIQYQAVTIPNYGKAESLNVSIAAAIFCERFIGKI